MGALNLANFRTSVRAAVGDVGTAFSDSIIDQSVSDAVADISRLAPRQMLHVEVLHSRDVAAESVTVVDDTWANLAYKLLDRTGAVTVTNTAATTTYAKNTDYIIDYAQGRIMPLSTGAATGDTPLLVTYKRSLLGIDLSAVTDLISVVRVEVQKGLASPPQVFESYARWGDLLWLLTNKGESQTRFSENDTVYVWYRGEHTVPTVSTTGTTPYYMDDIIIKGALAYSLFSKHRERTLQALTDTASARSALANAVADHTAIDALITSSATAITSMGTVLGTIDDEADTQIAAITTALDGVITELDKAATALTQMPVHLVTEATTGADALLKSGDDLIDAVNLGLNAAAEYREYAMAKMTIARGYFDEATGRIQHGLAIARSGELRIAKVSALMETALGYGRQAELDFAAIERHLALANLYMDQAATYLASADRESSIADRLLIDARERHNDYWGHLINRVESGHEGTKGSTMQLPT